MPTTLFSSRGSASMLKIAGKPTLLAKAGKPVHRRVAAGGHELLRVNPVIAPAHRGDLLADEREQALAAGVRLLASEEGALVHAVDGPVRGNLRADDAGELSETSHGPKAPSLVRSAKSSWKYIGCSDQRVPSLSNVAIRSAGATKSGCSARRHPGHEVDDRLLRRTRVPGRKRVRLSKRAVKHARRYNGNSQVPEQVSRLLHGRTYLIALNMTFSLRAGSIRCPSSSFLPA